MFLLIAENFLRINFLIVCFIVSVGETMPENGKIHALTKLSVRSGDFERFFFCHSFFLILSLQFNVICLILVVKCCIDILCIEYTVINNIPEYECTLCCRHEKHGL